MTNYYYYYYYLYSGFETAGLKPSMWPGGETEALARLERHLERRAWVASFGRPRMTPQSLMANQTGLNPYLRFGCLSPKTFYHQMSELYRKVSEINQYIRVFNGTQTRNCILCGCHCV
jgi:cryptochrome